MAVREDAPQVPWLRGPDNAGYRWLGRPDFPTMKIVVGPALARGLLFEAPARGQSTHAFLRAGKPRLPYLKQILI
jgi:hypothetical protein